MLRPTCSGANARHGHAQVVDDLHAAPGAAASSNGAGAADPSRGSEAYVGTLDDAVLHNINQARRRSAELGSRSAA